jgi:hypothetical protein
MGVQAHGLAPITLTLALRVTKWLGSCDLDVGPKMVAELYSRQATEWLLDEDVRRPCLFERAACA